MINLSNTNVIITGSTGEIGGSIVKKLYQENANIFATGTNIAKLENLKKNYKNIFVEKLDLSKTELIEEFVEKANKTFDNKIDVIINNAGVTSDNLAIRMKEQEWHDVINVNLNSTFLMCKFGIKKMLKNKKGKIINITSVVGHTGNIGQANYAASKAGIIGMSKSLALEYGKKNILINCISPGFISSKMTDKISDNMKEIMKSKIPVERFGTADDVANTALFLSSNLSNYITGETIHVNGGMYFS